MVKLKVAVLISGRGSNMLALLAASRQQDSTFEVCLVIANRSDAAGITAAQKAGIETDIIKPGDYETREDFEQVLHDRIEKTDTRLVCLAGFMWLLGDTFVQKWRDRLINIHPSLLPAFKGLNVQAQAVEMGVRFTGCTVHFVRPELDDGPIIVQAVVPVRPIDDEDMLAARILEQEHIIYPQAVKWIGEGRIRVSGERVLIENADIHNEAVISPFDTFD
jgi:phosphoribosylglycinamide formyltransferase-1